MVERGWKNEIAKGLENRTRFLHWNAGYRFDTIDFRCPEFRWANSICYAG